MPAVGEVDTGFAINSLSILAGHARAVVKCAQSIEFSTCVTVCVESIINVVDTVYYWL